MSLYTWSWLFLVIYIVAMIAIGQFARRKVVSADDFATARGSYGPLTLALAFAATAASGATFLGLPGLAYTHGVSTLWIAFAYPIGIYIGVLVCRKAVTRFGNSVGARSIPELLGERYGSELLRISVAVFSLILLFYLASQLVSGLLMFEMLLGIPGEWAVIITTAVLLAYVTSGGAHADILTDAAQGWLMVGIALLIAVMFLVGLGADGFSASLDTLRQQEAALVRPFNPSSNLTASPWAAVAVLIAHIPLGLLPHIGNKLWALKDERQQNRFVVIAFTLSMVLPAITLGGLTARVVFGDELFGAAGGANVAVPALFLETFPDWLAALLGIAVLSAILSTADGLVISTSQVFANDVYRKSIVPRFQSALSQSAIDRNVLLISRITTVLILVGAAVLGWMTRGMNVTLLMWTGVGGFVSALMGPLVIGSVWPAVTRRGALAGFWSGAVAFVLIHGQLISGLWLAGTALEPAGRWFAFYASNPYSAATLGAAVSVIVTLVVSVLTTETEDRYPAAVGQEQP